MRRNAIHVYKTPSILLAGSGAGVLFEKKIQIENFFFNQPWKKYIFPPPFLKNVSVQVLCLTLGTDEKQVRKKFLTRQK